MLEPQDVELFAGLEAIQSAMERFEDHGLDELRNEVELAAW
jgi:hypothetical protein